MYSIPVVFNKHNTTRVASCWFIIYYRLVMHGNSNIKFKIAFLLQLDESTDKSGLEVVLVFVHYLFQNKTEYDILHKCAVLKLLPFPTT